MDNFVIHQNARQYEWSGTCYLSIKSFFKGRAHYDVMSRQYEVSEKNYLILNNCTSYKLTIDTATPTESFCVFFSPSFISAAVGSIELPYHKLLDDYNGDGSRQVNLIERNYQHGDALSAHICQAKQLYPLMQEDRLWLRQMQHALLQKLLETNAGNKRCVEDIRYVKPATRQELYRRAYYAKDFIDACYSEDIGLDAIASVAMLSPSHLLRVYKSIFHTTPHQYIICKRMQLAKELLTTTDLSVGDVMHSTGYASLSNFSWIFKLHFGYPPTTYRKK